MKKTKKQSFAGWDRISAFIYGGIASAGIGAVAILGLGRGAISILAGLMIVAGYTFVVTHKQFSQKLKTLSQVRSLAPVMSVLVIGVVSLTGALFLNATFAWHPKGKISKTVQNVSTNSAVVDANTKDEAVASSPGDILMYTVTISNIAEPATNNYNDLAFTVMKDNLPEGVELISNPSTRGITENLGTILPGAEVVRTYKVRVVSTTDGAVLENVACYSADSLNKDNPQTGCDNAMTKVTTAPPTPTPTPEPTPEPTPTPTPSPEPTPEPTPTPESETPPELSDEPIDLSSDETTLPNTGPGEIAFIAAFAIIGGYVIHTLYWRIKSARPTAK